MYTAEQMEKSAAHHDRMKALMHRSLMPFVAAAAMLSMAAISAGLVPARRAARVDPATILKME